MQATHGVISHGTPTLPLASSPPLHAHVPVPPPAMFILPRGTTISLVLDSWIIWRCYMYKKSSHSYVHVNLSKYMYVQKWLSSVKLSAQCDMQCTHCTCKVHISTYCIHMYSVCTWIHMYMYTCTVCTCTVYMHIHVHCTYMCLHVYCSCTNRTTAK